MIRDGVASLAWLLVVAVACAMAGCGTPERSEPSREATGQAIEELPARQLDQLDPAVVAQYEALRRAVDEALATGDPASISEALGHLGMWHQTYRLLTAASRYFALALEWQDDPRWAYYLGMVHAFQPDAHERARQRFEQVLRHQPDDVPTLIRLGELALDGGRWHDAAARFDAVLALEPAQARALLGAGRAALLAGQPAEAAGWLRRAHAEAPQSGAVAYSLAQALRAAGDVEGAAAIVVTDETLAPPTLVDPRYEALLAMRTGRQRHLGDGKRALAAGRTKAAIEQFRLVLATAPDDLEARFLLAQALLQGGQSAAAHSEYGQVLAADPDHVGARVGSASIHARAGRRAAAEADLVAARQVAPDQPAVLLNLAQIYRLDGRYDEALEAVARLRRHRPQTSLASFWHGATLCLLGRFAEAREALEMDLSTVTDAHRSQWLLARILAVAPDESVRDPARALDLARAAHAARPTVDAGETVAMAMAAVGERAAAVAWQHAAVVALRQRVRSPNPLIDRARARLERYRAGSVPSVPWAVEERPVALPMAAPSRSGQRVKPTSSSNAASTDE